MHLENQIVAKGSMEECEEVLNSEEFEEYVTTLASRNSYATRYGFRMRNGRFFILHSRINT